MLWTSVWLKRQIGHALYTRSGVVLVRGARIIATMDTYPVAVSNQITIGLDPGLYAVTVKVTYKKKEEEEEGTEVEEE